MTHRYTTPAALRRELEGRMRRSGYRDATTTKTRYVTVNDRECLEAGVFEYATTRMPLETLEGYERALQAMPGVIATRIIHEDPRAARGNVNALRDQVVVTHLRMWDEP
jgi:hypothetical protein